MRYLPVAVFACLVLFALPPAFSQAPQGRGAQREAKPVPRWPDGHPRFAATLKETGLWAPRGSRLADLDVLPPDPTPFQTRDGFPGKPRLSEVPFQPWARDLYEFRQITQFEPYTRCKPSGGPRQIATAYGTELWEMPESKRFYITQTGGPHSYRVVYMDGRPHPADLEPSYYGHSIGYWEGDTLVVDTVGFNEKMWIDREGTPTTEKLHLIERFTRTDFYNMTYEVTIDDPGAYTAPWKTGFALQYGEGQEHFEYICQDNNHAPELMVGGEGAVDRTSRVAP